MISPLALLSRRHTIQGMMATMAVASLASCANLIPQSVGLALTPNPLTDPAVFNFALNLEYLEAEYYARGLTGEGLSNDLLGPKPGKVTGGRKVVFNNRYIAEFMAEIAEDERNHVRFLRGAIRKSPLIEMSRPELDLEGSFRAAASAAGLGDNFDPFADETSFLLGAFIFEDVGVTAYAGAAKLISDRDSLEAAAGILAVEAYHGGLIRGQIGEMGQPTIDAANLISAARDKLDGPAPTEAAIGGGNRIIVAPSDADAIAYHRTPQQVLNIVYNTPEKNKRRGGFFPRGFNGVVLHT